MKDCLGVGVIGCGAISANHFAALRQVPGAALAAVCDNDPAHLEKAAREQGVRGYADYRELLADARVEAVHICTPHYLHHRMAIDALHAGKHVLCEKPMAIRLADAQAMAQAARESGRQLGICFQNRYNGASRRIRALLDSGALGAVLGGSAIVAWDRGKDYYAQGDWRGKWATEGGALLINQAIHTLDLLRDFAGEITDVRCSMSAKRLDDAIEAEDTCDMLLTTRSGARLLFYASNCGVGNAPVQLSLTCEKADVLLLGSRLTLAWKDGREEHEDFSVRPACGKDYWGNSHGALIEDFYRCVRAGEPFPIGPEEALKTTALLEAAYTRQAEPRWRPG